MPLNYARRLTGRDRTVLANRHLGCVLAFVAGAANAGGFLAVRQYTSHMTGIVSVPGACRYGPLRNVRVTSWAVPAAVMTRRKIMAKTRAPTQELSFETIERVDIGESWRLGVCRTRPTFAGIHAWAHETATAGPRTVPPAWLKPLRRGECPVRSSIAGGEVLECSRPPRPSDVLRARTARAPAGVSRSEARAGSGTPNWRETLFRLFL